MSKETPELVAECWQILVEYIPRREQAAAAEQLYSYLTSVLDKGELDALADLDSDFGDARDTAEAEEEIFHEDDDYNERFDDE